MVSPVLGAVVERSGPKPEFLVLEMLVAEPKSSFVSSGFSSATSGNLSVPQFTNQQHPLVTGGEPKGDLNSTGEDLCHLKVSLSQPSPSPVGLSLLPDEMSREFSGCFSPSLNKDP